MFRIVVAFFLTSQFVFAGISSSSILSEDAISFLQDGIELPVQLSIESNARGGDSYEPNGTVLVRSLSNGSVLISDFRFDKKYQHTLSKKLIQELNKDPVVLVNTLRVEVGAGSAITLDLDEMMVMMTVSPQDFGEEEQAPSYAKPTSMNNEASMLTNYNVNAYASGKTIGDLSNYNLSSSFNSVLSYEENYVEISNFSSFSSGASAMHELDRLVFARDQNGLRIEAGQDTSAPQRIGTISNFSVEKLYYASITNSADSILMRNSASSLIPMIVMMPAAGEVRVYKNDRLIYQSALNMGRHTLDTTSFPYGVYEVSVDTIIGGQVRDTRRYRVNKPTNGRGGEQWVWQLWAGQAQYDALPALDEATDESDFSSYPEPQKARAPVGGVNVASSIGEVTWDANLYHSPTSWVAEMGSRWQPTEWLSLEGQFMKSSQGGKRAFYQAALSSSWGPSLVLTSERGQYDKDEYEQSNPYGTDQAQLQLPLPEALFGGSLVLGYNIDREYNEHSWNIDYNQSLLDNDWLSLSLDTGMDKTIGEQGTTNYYVSLNASLPLGANVDMGVSEQNGVRTASVSAGMELDGFFNYVSIDAQGELVQQHIESPSTTLQTNYDSNYASGSTAISLTQNSVNLSNSTSGLVAFNKHGVAPGKSGGQSGFMVIMPDKLEDGELELLVDNTAVPLHAGNNFVSAVPYEEHNVMVQVGSDAHASYDIFTEDDSYTLYPGNVPTLKPTVKQMVTVFGRLVDESGAAIANASVKNHIGETITDEQGGFSIDVDAAIPEVQVSSDKTGEFKVAMTIEHASGGIVRLKDVVWSPHKSDVYIVNPLF
ncbi:CS1-pili formation C-terminal domain-containing protein [Aeromonas sp. HMWF015]|uniref:CS1-pili formation C-terminal domain-containing protein n=1 Tax=Aeromonas sp. HMWF015 TaxID=2056851 RepID=UPI000D355D2C|nr:CS1-pili formation C-terminal domain-containing protein [Aeromonas sp. HMWF015]PTT50207.1 hypothetical protein DBR13_20915 [Aeromonas sp. HMWF015]